MLGDLLQKPAVRKVLALEGKPQRPAYEDDGEADAGPAAATGASATPRSEGTPWELVDDSKRTTTLRRGGRVVLWIVLGLLAFAGLRSTFSDGTTRTVVQKPAATSTFPEGEAQAIALRFSRAYLELPAEGEAAKEARLALLRQDSPADLDATWDGQGTQTVSELLPGQVSATSATAGTIEVLAQVVPGSAEPQTSETPTAPTKPSAGATTAKTTKPPKPGPTPTPAAPKPTPTAAPSSPTNSSPSPKSEETWLALSVPVEVVHGRVIVTGAPVFTSVPPAAPMTTRADPDLDPRLSTSTRPVAEAFFQAWASGDPRALAAATAPGSKLSPLQGLRFSTVSDWAIYAEAEPVPGSTTKAAADRRTATGSVVWELPSGAKFTQTYIVTLRAVSAGGATDWRVTDAQARTTHNNTTKE